MRTHARTRARAHTHTHTTGSKVGRQVSESEKQQATVIYKDLDFLENQHSIVLGSVRRQAVLDQVPLIVVRVRMRVRMRM